MINNRQAKKILSLIAAIAAVLFLACSLPMQQSVAETMPGENSRTLAQPTGKPSCTVIYHPNGGTGQTIEENVETDTDYTIKEQAYKKELYVFIGWDSQPNGLGISYEVGKVVRVKKDIVLYAVWTQVM